MDKMIFAAYHTDLSEKAIENIQEVFPLFREHNWASFLPNSQNCLDIMFQSILLAHPGSHRAILTDHLTHLSFPPEIAICRYNVDPNEPAYMRLIAQIEFLKQAEATSHILFLDYDMLVQGDLFSLFDQNFDIALTYREFYQGKRHPCPINGGLIIIPAKKISKALSFLDKVLAIYDQNYSDYRVWGGGQRSLSDAVGNQSIFQRTSDLLDIEGIQVLLLPDEIYNYTLGGHLHMVDYKPNKKILHFKGPRKKDMLIYWNEYLRPRNSHE